MHELGVVFHIADTLARIAEENQVTRIRRVTLELGEVSTVVPEYLIDVWNWNCKRTPLLTGCELVIERIPTWLRRSAAIALCCFCCSASSRREARIFMARSLFLY